MNIIDLVYLGLDCTDAEVVSIMTLIGIVVWGIKVFVPIILIIVGMIDMAKAVTEKSDDKIKAAQASLIKKSIAAVIVFLIPTIVGLIMGVIGANNYKNCMICVNNPTATVNNVKNADGTTSTVKCQINVE